MKIHKFSNIVAFPFFIVAIILGYFAFQSPQSNYLVWCIAPVMALILIYLFSPQIDYWWMSKNPVDLDPKIKAMLDKANAGYENLSPEQKQEFNKRLLLFTRGKEFIAKGMETENMAVPYDVQNMISHIPVMMTIGRDDFLFKQFDRVVLYKHPFGTPINRFLHTMETHGEDGVVILSLEHVHKALFQRGHHYDVAWHAFAESFISAYPKEPYPDLPSDVWDSIEKISPQTKDEILGTLGFKNIDPMPVLINLYFNQKEKFKAVLPTLATKFQIIFKDQLLTT